VTFKA
jgi:hypothetical protein